MLWQDTGRPLPKVPHLGAAPASSYAQAERHEVKIFVKRALVDQEMFTARIDYKQTVRLSFVVTVDIQHLGKMEQVCIVVKGPMHIFLHTVAQLGSQVLSCRTLRCSTSCGLMTVGAYCVLFLAILMNFLRKLVDKGSFWPGRLGPCSLRSYLTYMPLRGSGWFSSFSSSSSSSISILQWKWENIDITVAIIMHSGSLK